jgi:hypothetical protein
MLSCSLAFPPDAESAVRIRPRRVSRAIPGGRVSVAPRAPHRCKSLFQGRTVMPQIPALRLEGKTQL